MKKGKIIILLVVLLAAAVTFFTKDLFKSYGPAQSANATIVNDNEGFYEKYTAAKQSGTPVAVVFTTKPYCSCEWDKVLDDSYTLTEYNIRAFLFLVECRKKFGRKVITIYLETNNMGYDQTRQYIKLKEELGIKKEPALAIMDGQGNARVMEGLFEKNDLINALQKLIN